MHIILKQEGGFAGITRVEELTSESLSESQTEALRQAIRNANFFNQPVSRGNSRLGADQITYTLTIEDGANQRTIQITDGAMSDEVADLIASVKRIAKDNRRSS